MVRRKKNDSLAVALVAAPWQVSATLGGLAFVALRWLFPWWAKGNMLLVAMIPLARLFSLPAAAVFAILALSSYFRSKSAAAPKRPFELPSFDNATSPRIEPRIIAEQDTKRVDPVLAPPRPTTWSLEALRSLEWKRFELLCAKYYEMCGFKAETMQSGPDGGKRPANPS